jgi:hypothetical protein|tara:strand:+ start:3934 stop:4203 length:270 start_codon:yes stop_codon:yes gene_type:complete
MEAEVGTPIEYNPEEFLNKDNDLHEQEPENNEQYYVQPQQPMYTQQLIQPEKQDIFSNLDKTGYVIIFVAFLLGFFMGKTMQPVILRPG